MEDDFDGLIKFLRDVESLEEYFGVDNLNDLERIVKGLEAQVSALTRHRDWFIERTGANDIVQAKSRVDALISGSEGLPFEVLNKKTIHHDPPRGGW
jgi:hypothetical protein